MTCYDDTTDPDSSGGSPYTPPVSILPPTGYGQPDVGAGDPSGSFDPQDLAGHAKASQAISDVLIPTIASALNTDPNSLTKARLYDYGADALRRIYGGGSLDDLQRGQLAKSAIDFFAGIPDDADGPTIQGKLGQLAAHHIVAHGALQQWAAGQGTNDPNGGASAGEDDEGSSNGAVATGPAGPPPNDAGGDPTLGSQSGPSADPSSGAATVPPGGSSNDPSGSGGPGASAASGGLFQRLPSGGPQNPLIDQGTDQMSPTSPDDPTGSNPLFTPTSGPAPRPGELIPSKTPAPDWKARAKTALGWMGDAGDLVGAATDADPRGPATQNAYEDATGYFRGTAVNRRTGKPVAEVLVNDKFATIKYRNGKTEYYNVGGPRDGLDAYWWNRLDGVSYLAEDAYQQHSLAARELGVAKDLGAAPLSVLNGAESAIEKFASKLAGKSSKWLGGIMPNKDDVEQQGWAKQAMFEMRAAQLLARGQRPGSANLPAKIKLVPRPSDP